MENLYLTVPEVAKELDMTPDGVYKLIERGKLPAVRRSERGLRISRVVLEAYQRRLLRGGKPPEISYIDDPVSPATLLQEFIAETGMRPKEWENRWKTDQIDDTADNMRLTIRALALLASDHDKIVQKKMVHAG